MGAMPAWAQTALVQEMAPQAATQAAPAPEPLTATATATPTAVPAGPMGEPRCIVTGKVINIKRGEGVSANTGQRIAVPVMELEVESSVTQDPRYNGPFCQQLIGQPLPGTRPLVHFRLCDPQSEFYTSDRVRGVAGNNLGGGYYCIEQVVRTLE
ncbi:MAG: hypothetical protein EBX37_12190 [Alphaproteobacteria bacterium]|nr:hypothetical protein [Alphaproteobacteria bacterium]